MRHKKNLPGTSSDDDDDKRRPGGGAGGLSWLLLAASLEPTCFSTEEADLAAAPVLTIIRRKKSQN